MKTNKKDYIFDYINLHTSYLFNIERYEEGKAFSEIKSFHSRTKNTPCFGKMFRHLSTFTDASDVSASIGIYINASLDTFEKTRNNNLVVCNKATIIRHLELAKKIVNFEYTLTKRVNYYLRIKMVGKPIQVKFLCAWVRYLYEYPANVLMYDIYRLIDAGKFTEESIFNLIMALNTTLNTTGIRHDQCIKVYGKFQSDEDLKKKLEKGSRYLCVLYDDIGVFDRVKLNATRAEERSLNYWLDEDKLIDRYLVYQKAVDNYKKKSNQ